MHTRWWLSIATPGLVACAGTQTPQTSEPSPATMEAASETTAAAPLFEDAFPSTYEPIASGTTVIRNATILTAAGTAIDRGAVLIEDGQIAAVGTSVTVPPDATVIDGTGKWVTPGVIDTHSHLGVYPSPSVAAVSDGNEATEPVTAGVWAEHSIWPQDPGFGWALAGGVTAMQILPGSANLIGGRGVTVKPVPARTYQEMKFPDAPHGLKMACGENPKRVYRSRGPSTRMGNVEGYRSAWIDAAEYLQKLEKWREDGSDPDDEPKRDLNLESLAGVLRGEILVHNHCYRADEMATMIGIAKEFGYSISSFHHAVEAYKIRDLLAENDVCASMWADWWGFKLEAYDGIQENVPLVHTASACAIVHSDDGHGIQRLNQEAAKAMAAGQRGGLDVDREDAIRWITINPARALGVADVTGSLEVGKNADVVIWSGDPFSVYSKAEKVFIDGALLYDRYAPNPLVFGDFMTGILPKVVTR